MNEGAWQWRLECSSKVVTRSKAGDDQGEHHGGDERKEIMIVATPREDAGLFCNDRCSCCCHRVPREPAIAKRGSDYTSGRPSIGVESGAQAFDHAVDFVRGVVMDQADAEKSAVSLDAEALCEVQCIVVAIPSENAAVAKFSGQVRGVMIFYADREGGAPGGNAPGIGDSVEVQTGNFCESRKHSQRKFAFVRLNGAVGRAQQVPA